MTEWSRYRRDFQEISFIAAGGFGNVFKALHRLDGIEYAVKKIVVRSGRVKSIMQHLEEVKTLAKLNHTNIVSYKGAWIEPTLPLSLIPSLPSTSGVQNQSNSLTRKGKGKYKSCTNQNISVQGQSSYSSSSSDHSPKGSEEYNKSINIKHGMYIHAESREQKRTYENIRNYTATTNINERFHELNSSTNIIGQRIIEENTVSENVEKTNSNSISFRSDSKQRHYVTETNTNYTSSDSCKESDGNKKLYPYIRQMVCIHFFNIPIRIYCIYFRSSFSLFKERTVCDAIHTNGTLRENASTVA